MTLGAHGQTKKIANASSSTSGPNFNWTTSDNLGAIMEYEDIVKFHYQYDSASNMIIAIDTSLDADTITSDSFITIYEEKTTYDTLRPDTFSNRKVKILKGPSKKELRKMKSKSKPNDEKGLQCEIKKTPSGQQSQDGQTNFSALFMLLLIPISYLMVKKT